MSTYNGEKFIRKQLDSIFDQTYQNILVYVRDDGSTDRTLDIINEYCISKNIVVNKGKNVGAKNSFIEAICSAPDADYYALADQDDLWFPEKVEVAVEKLKASDDLPAMYHSSLILIDENDQRIGQKGVYVKRPFLEGETHPVVGCTVVFNCALMKLLKKYKPINFPMHDAWIHRLCQAVNGEIVFDSNSYIGYRQHSSNEVGAKKGIVNAVKRRLHYYKKMPKNIQSNMIKEILNEYKDIMPKDNIEKAKLICEYKNTLKNKLKLLFSKRYFRGRLWWQLEQRYFVLINKY